MGRLRVLARIAVMAFQAVWAFKLRSLFVASGVAMGIAALALIVASVDGAQRKAREIVEWFGPDAAFILGGDIRNRPVGQRVLTLSWTDAERLRQSLPGAYLVIPMRAKRGLTAKYRSQNMQVATVVGATENYAQAWNWPLVEGRDLTERDVKQGAKVGLIGATPAKELFGQESPIGKTVFLGDLPVQIVGRLLERGSVTGGGTPIDERIIIPLTTLTQRFNMDRQYFRALRVKFHEPEYMAAHTENLRAFLRHLHRLQPGEPDDFTILTAEEILKFLSMFQGGLLVFLGVTASVAVLVGGFVLANLFYLSVSERTREIGLKKAMGATHGHIVLQFMLEAVILTLVGAMFGVALGIGLGQLLSRLDILQIQLSYRVVFFSLAAAVGIGVVFGLRPARQAAGLDPIEALKG